MIGRCRAIGWLALLGPLWAACGGCIIGRELSQTRIDKGDAALRSRYMDVALAEFREAVRLDPHYATAHYKLGVAYKQNGDLTQAAESLQEAVRLDPTAEKPVFELGEVYRLLDKLTQAIRAYALACELAPKDFDARFRLATCYHQTGDLEQAASAYREAIRLDDRNPQARSNLGAVLATQGKDYEAIKAYKESWERDEQPIVLVNMATVYLKQERWEIAHRTLSMAIDMDPNCSPAYERLGYCLWREQAYEMAAERYRKAIELDRKNAAAHAGLGVVLMTMYLDQPDKVELRNEAVEAWHSSLELNPEQPKLRELVDKYRAKTEPPLLTIEK